MLELTEQQIAAFAPNPAAAANGREISRKGGIVRRECSADERFFLGECTGSGKKNYIVTADFIDPAQPVFRCTCPSRQIPCKHALALLYEISAGKAFGPYEIPEEILKKRAQKQAKAAKAAEGTALADEKPAAAAKTNKSAQTKKLKKQLDGLDLASRLVEDLMQSGLGAMGGASLETYRQMSKQLGDYYLPGPQRHLNRLILEIAAYQKEGDDSHYDSAIYILESLSTLIRKAHRYLCAKLENGEVGQDDNLLFEELGGVWKLSELEALGLSKKDVRLAQLAFWVEFDEARQEYIDTGCWADLENGEISVTRNYRPLKALKFVKQEDSFFGVMELPSAAYYPGEGNRRVRWDAAKPLSYAPQDFIKLCSFACGDLAAPAKEVKNILKNPLSDCSVCRLIRFSGIGTCAEGTTLTDPQGGSILLADMPGMEPTVERLASLSDPALLKNQVLLGAFWHHARSKRLVIQPLSILTPDRIIRLLY